MWHCSLAGQAGLGYSDAMLLCHVARARLLSCLFFALFAVQCIVIPFAPVSAQESEVPWLYENSDVPVDRSWTFGVLDNGVRYAVKKNSAPPGAVSVRVRVDAGSLMEEESEQGFAHLLEHLAFSSSEHVPPGDAKRVWQRLGATFGSDSNAKTTHTQTVYELELPDANYAKLDESLKILSGMVRAPRITPKTVGAEVPIVLAELQDQQGPQLKLADATREHFFAGQRLAERRPIGTPETLRAATSDKVKAFHRRWYRPENMVVVIAGDGPPETFEKLVKDHFGGWTGQGPAGEFPVFGDPDPDSAIADIAIDPTFPRAITMAVLRPWRRVDDTIVYNEGLLTNELALAMINRRLEERARAGGSYLQANVGTDDVSRSADATFVSVIPLGDDWRGALSDVRAVIADAMTTVPSQQDMDREIAEFDAALSVGVEGYGSESAKKQADNVVMAVDIRETIATPQVALDVFRGMLPRLTPERMLQATRDLFTGTVTKAMLTLPEPVADARMQLAETLTAAPDSLDNVRVDQAAIGFDSLPPIGKTGTVTQAEPIEWLGMERIAFANGVRALLFPNTAERNKIMVNVRFGRGYSGIVPEEGDLLWSGPLALLESGIGTLDQNALDRLTTGRRIGLSFAVDEDAFELSGDTRPADLRDQLYLMAAKLSDPRWDTAPVERAKAARLIGYDTYFSSPRAVLDRELEAAVRSDDPRWRFPEREDIAALTPEVVRGYWEPTLAQGPIEVMLFGDFDRDEAVAALTETFGAMPAREAAVQPPAAARIAFPAPSDEPQTLYHRGDSDSAAAFIAWPTGGGQEDIRVSRRLYLLAAIFNDRLFEQFRLQAGISYSPQAFQQWPTHFREGGYVAAQSLVKPADVDKFFDLAESIAADLRANPVSADELTRNAEPLRQLIARATSGNAFWLWQLEGASYEPSKFDALRTLLSDFTGASAEELQALAQRYLPEAGGWKLVVLPEGDAP